MTTLLSILTIFAIGYLVGWQRRTIQSHDAAFERLSKIVSRIEKVTRERKT